MELPTDSFGIESANINIKWIENIYENIKKIEDHERLAREGCNSIIDYSTIPFNERNVVLADIQYKNLKMLLSEFMLVIPDIVPVIGEDNSKKFMGTLERIGKIVNNKNNMVEQIRSDVNKTIKDARTTVLFDNALKVLSNCRIELIKLLRNVLYMPQSVHGRR